MIILTISLVSAHTRQPYGRQYYYSSHELIGTGYIVLCVGRLLHRRNLLRPGFNKPSQQILRQTGKACYKSQDVLRFSIDYSHDSPCKCSHTPTIITEGNIIIINMHQLPTSNSFHNKNSCDIHNSSYLNCMNRCHI